MVIATHQKYLIPTCNCLRCKVIRVDKRIAMRFGGKKTGNWFVLYDVYHVENLFTKKKRNRTLFSTHYAWKNKFSRAPFAEISR